jgi:hypothetical protein
MGSTPRLLPDVDLTRDKSFGNFLVQQTSLFVTCCAAPRPRAPAVETVGDDTSLQDPVGRLCISAVDVIGASCNAPAAPAAEAEEEEEPPHVPFVKGAKTRVRCGVPTPCPPLPYSRTSKSPVRPSATDAAEQEKEKAAKEARSPSPKAASPSGSGNSSGGGSGGRASRPVVRRTAA